MTGNKFEFRAVSSNQSIAYPNIALKATDEIKKRADKLEQALGHESNGSAAKHFRDVVVPAMATLREAGDALEVLMPHERWPLATYREMLFIK